MIYAVQLGERRTRCSSPHCIAELVRQGWRLSDPEQLGMLVQELMTVPPDPSHQPADHRE